MSSQLQQIKAKALAEKRKKQTSVNENVESCFFRQLKESSLHPRIIKQARKSGTLNLSNRGLAESNLIFNVIFIFEFFELMFEIFLYVLETLVFFKD